MINVKKLNEFKQRFRYKSFSNSFLVWLANECVKKKGKLYNFRSIVDYVIIPIAVYTYQKLNRADALIDPNLNIYLNKAELL